MMSMLRPHRLVVAVFLLGISLIAFSQNTPSSADESFAAKYLILPGGKNGGAMSATTTTQDLIRIYGKENVVETSIQNANGEDESVTELFRSDPLRSAVLEWKDPYNRRTLMNIEISGAKSLWRTTHGITLGTTLKELERLNGKPFLLSGFAWDYSGTVMSWHGGMLAQELKEVDHPGRVLLRLDCAASAYQQPTYLSVTGERTFSSMNPAMQELNPTIDDVIWFFH
jgi:hypothetical protein